MRAAPGDEDGRIRLTFKKKAPYMLLVDAPMYRNRWRADEAAHKTYFGLRDGARDAFLTRHVTHEWAAWRADALWETLYFSLSVWGSMLTVYFKPGA